MVGSSLLDPSSGTKSQHRHRFRSSPVAASYAPTQQAPDGPGNIFVVRPPKKEKGKS